MSEQNEIDDAAKVGQLAEIDQALLGIDQIRSRLGENWCATAELDFSDTSPADAERVLEHVAHSCRLVAEGEGADLEAGGRTMDDVYADLLALKRGIAKLRELVPNIFGSTPRPDITGAIEEAEENVDNKGRAVHGYLYGS